MEQTIVKDKTVSVEDYLIGCLGEEWYRLLGNEFQKDYMKGLMRFISQRRSEVKVFPPKGEVFNAYKLTPYNKVRVCIIGQDPYINLFEAHGLAFSTYNGQSTPSLRQIEMAVRRECYDGSVDYKWGNNLIRWAVQGVLLLNTVLTVDEGKSRSHAGMGWELFTAETIKQLDKKNIIFMLWGKDAQSLKEYIKISPFITAEHPVAGVRKGRDWHNELCFKRVNDLLKDKILW